MPQPPVKVSFSLKGQKAVLRKLDQFSRRAKNVLREEVERTAEKVQRTSRGLVPRDTGDLRQSIQITYRPDRLGARVGTNSEHAWPIHSGLKRRWYRPKALEPWVDRNIQVARSTESAAFLVARSIAETGTKGHPFLFPAFDREKKPFSRTVRRRIREIPRRLATVG
jgi:hypothetical protein